ncbi:MAG: hypothetical protein KAI84_18610, partial [Gammaproteobacteria bacterium]|nr:hypothetical protein [Gammaproteobacteria bacterium]
IWEKVVTEWIGENESEVYYQAFPSKFSPFAIVGKENIDNPMTEEVASTPETSDEPTFVPAAAEDTFVTDNEIVEETVERKYVWIVLSAGVVLFGFLRIRHII